MFALEHVSTYIPMTFNAGSLPETNRSNSKFAPETTGMVDTYYLYILSFKGAYC